MSCRGGAELRHNIRLLEDHGLRDPWLVDLPV